MAPRRSIYDAIIRHRIDLQRYSKREAAVVLDLMGHEDSRLVTMLRGRLPHLAPGVTGAPRTAELLGSVRALRAESFARVRGQLAADLFELAKVEGAAIERIAVTALRAPVRFNPLREGALRSAVADPIFGGGRGAGQTLTQWFSSMAQADQQRLRGAVELGVNRQEPVDVQVRRIAGTRANGYQDGLLSISRREAEAAVRTGVVHVANAAQVEWNRANADVVTGSQWVAMMDERTEKCDVCPGLDGGFVPNGHSPAPAGMEDLGEVSPPAHPNCRCTLIPIFDLDALADKVPDEQEAAA